MHSEKKKKRPNSTQKISKVNLSSCGESRKTAKYVAGDEAFVTREGKEKESTFPLLWTQERIGKHYIVGKFSDLYSHLDNWVKLLKSDANSTQQQWTAKNITKKKWKWNNYFLSSGRTINFRWFVRKLRIMGIL